MLLKLGPIKILGTFIEVNIPLCLMLFIYVMLYLLNITLQILDLSMNVS